MNNWPKELICHVHEDGAMDIELNKGLAAVIREQVIHATRVALLAEGFDTEFITDSKILELVKQTTHNEI